MILKEINQRVEITIEHTTPNDEWISIKPVMFHPTSDFNFLRKHQHQTHHRIEIRYILVASFAMTTMVVEEEDIRCISSLFLMWKQKVFFLFLPQWKVIFHLIVIPFMLVIIKDSVQFFFHSSMFCSFAHRENLLYYFVFRLVFFSLYYSQLAADLTCDFQGTLREGGSRFCFPKEGKTFAKVNLK